VNAKEKLGIGCELLDLVELIRVVERHLLDVLLSCIANVGFGLAWLSVDDARWVNASLECKLNLSFGGTVETSTESCKQTKDLRVWVAFDSLKRMLLATILRATAVKKLTIVRLDSRQVHLPPQVLAVDITKVSDEESVFFTRFAYVLVNSLDTLLESLRDQLLAQSMTIGREVCR